MFLEFVATKRDGSFIEFRVDIDRGRVDSVAYEYHPSWEYKIPIRFDRIMLFNIIQSNDYTIHPQEADYAVVDRFTKKSLSLLLKA